MASKKPKIQGYIERSLFDCFEAYSQEKELSQSQALERILAGFFGSNQEIEQGDRFEKSWQRISQELKNLQERVARIEISNNLKSELLALSSNLESESIEIDSNLESESPEINSNLEGDTLEIANNLESALLEIGSNLESESPEINSNLEGDTLEIGSNLESESLLSRAELEKFVICEIDREIGRYSYWVDARHGFTTRLLDAKRYKSINTLQQPMLKILSDPKYSYINKQPARFDLRYNPVRFFVENPQPTGKILASM